MPCAQHGRACAEPPAVVNCPVDGSALAVNKLLGKGGFARVYRVTRIPRSPIHHGRHDPKSLTSNLLPLAPTLSPLLPAPASTTTPTVSAESTTTPAFEEDDKQHTDSHAVQSSSALTTNSHFALKVISKCRLHNTPSALDALKSEVSIHLKLRHPSIVSLLTYWEDPHRVYLLLDLVEGPSLEEYVTKRHRLTENEACLYIAQTLEALSYLHSNLIVHKDVKLANILLSPDFTRIYLCDFGLSGCLDASSNIHRSPICGTPNYVAPELLTSQPASQPQSHFLRRRVAAPCSTEDVTYMPSVDLWSAGIVLFMMLAGHGPFDTENGPDATFRRIRTARFTFPIGLKLSVKAKAFIRSLLAEAPSKRPTADQALRHVFFEICSPDDSAPHSTIYKRIAGTTEEHLVPSGTERDASQQMTKQEYIAYRRTRVNREGGSECKRKTNRKMTDGSGSVPHHFRPSLNGTEDVCKEQRVIPRPTYNTRAKSSGPHTTDRDVPECGDKRKYLGRVRSSGRLKSSHGQFKNSSQGSAMAASVRDELTYLSLSLSAALVKGRRYLEEDGAFIGDVWDSQRAMSVTTEVDGVKDAPPLVRRWLDYTSKYGFATLMEDGHVGCCFNDGSIMFVVSDSTTHVPDVAYIAPFAIVNVKAKVNNNEKVMAAGGKVLGVEMTTDVSKKACLCTRFAEMMAENRRVPMHELPSACNVSFVRPDEDMDSPVVDHEQPSMSKSYDRRHPVKHRDDSPKHRNVVFVREWARMRCGKAAAFRLSNHSVHVKFDVSGSLPRRDDGLTHCDDFVFDLKRGILFYRKAQSKHAQICNLVDLAEFSSTSGQVYAQLMVCAQAVSHFLE